MPPAERDERSAALARFAGVTHCYLRESNPPDSDFPDLWFTLSAPAERFADEQSRVRQVLDPYPVFFLPALRRYKVDVVFGAAVRTREESVRDDLPPPDALDRKIIAALQGDTEVRPDYFAALAERLGMKEWDLLSKLELWRRNGRLKRIGLLLDHRQAGFTANGMCCWQVAGDTQDAGRLLAASPHVTHCYERAALPNFPYNLYAMIHCKSVEEAQMRFDELSALLPPQISTARTILLSTKQYKKTSMTFFI